MTDTKTRIVILGGGFGGMYAALRLEKKFGRRDDVDITLVNKDNFFLFTPMLHEVAASDLDPSNIVNPFRKLLRKVRFFDGRVLGVDLGRQTVRVSHGEDPHEHDLPYDHLVLGLGSVTNFYAIPGLEDRAITMRSLEDAMRLRHRLIECLEQADFECCESVRRGLLTVCVAGAGFAGVETIAGINDFLRQAVAFYPNLRASDFRLVLVHPGSHILPELGEKLGAYAQRKLAGRGVEILGGVKVTGVSDRDVQLSDGGTIPAHTLVWTAGTAPHPLLSGLGVAKDRGRIVVDEFMRVQDAPGVWALGDCALVPDGRGRVCPPTAQHASREGRVLAENVAASISGRKLEAFRFTTIGQLAAIGRRTGVARIFGINFSGFLAWWLWRTIYLLKLPRMEKKLRVMLDWTLDLFFTKDLVQFVNFNRTGETVTSGRLRDAA